MLDSFLFKSIATTTKRFPAVLAFCAVGSISLVVGVEGVQYPLGDVFLNVSSAGFIIAPFAFILALSEELSLEKPTVRWLIRIGLVLAFGFVFSLIRNLGFLSDSEELKLNSAMVLSYLSLLIFPFRRLATVRNYWNFQFSLWSTVGIGFVALNIVRLGFFVSSELINEDFQGTYGFDGDSINGVMFGFILPFFVLSRIPNLDRLAMIDLPAIVRKSSQMILLPFVVVLLVTIYFGAAMQFTGSESSTNTFPVSVIVIGIIGLLSWMILHPWIVESNPQWLRVFYRTFFGFYLPVVGASLFLNEVWILEFGLTESSYYVRLSGCVFVIMSVLLMILPQVSMRLVVTGLFITFFASIFGPWSASNSSRSFHLNRIDDLLVVANMRSEAGEPRPHIRRSAEATMAAIKISRSLTYIFDNHSWEGLPAWATARAGDFPSIIRDLNLDGLIFEEVPTGHFYIYVSRPQRVTHEEGMTVYLIPLRQNLWRPGFVTTRRPDSWEFTLVDGNLVVTSPDLESARLTGDAIKSALGDLGSLRVHTVPPSDLRFEISVGNTEIEIAFDELTLDDFAGKRVEIGGGSFLISVPAD